MTECRNCGAPYPSPHAYCSPECRAADQCECPGDVCNCPPPWED